MVTQKIEVTCPNCNSTNVSWKRESTVLQKRCVTDFSLDHQYWVPSVVKETLECHCNHCGRNFSEYLGTEHIPLSWGEIEV